MIGYLCGRLVACSDQEVVVDAGGVGYEVVVGQATRRRLVARPQWVELFLHTHLSLNTAAGRSAFQLIGFDSIDDRAAFRWLLGVSKLGPKTALDLVDALGAADLAKAVQRGNLGVLTAIKGVGTRTAERILSELRRTASAPHHWRTFEREQRSRRPADQLPPQPAAPPPHRDPGPTSEPSPATAVAADPFDDALSALINLGYTRHEALGALREVAGEAGWELAVEDFLRRALALIQARRIG